MGAEKYRGGVGGCNRLERRKGTMGQEAIIRRGEGDYLSQRVK